MSKIRKKTVEETKKCDAKKTCTFHNRVRKTLCWQPRAHMTKTLYAYRRILNACNYITHENYRKILLKFSCPVDQEVFVTALAGPYLGKTRPETGVTADHRLQHKYNLPGMRKTFFQFSRKSCENNATFREVLALPWSWCQLSVRAVTRSLHKQFLSNNEHWANLTPKKAANFSAQLKTSTPKYNCLRYCQISLIVKSLCGQFSSDSKCVALTDP